MSNYFAHMGAYLRFVLRRERVISAVWIACIAGLSAMFAALYPGLLPGRPELIQMAATMSSPTMVAMMGNVYGMESLSQASVMAQECLVWFLITAGMMNIFLVNRHTRVDEELGRLEMFRALPVGRLTGAAATTLFAFCANLAAGVLTALLLLALDIGGTTAGGAFAYGLSIGAVGFVFAGLTLLAAQLFSTAHGVSGFGFAMLGLFYIMRAVGDVSGSTLSLISPIGLGQRVEAFYQNAMWPVAVLLLEGVALTAVSFMICAARDHGAGVLPAKKGRTGASRFLRGPLGFAWRISRGASLGWGIGLLVLGAAYGSVCTELDAFVQGNDMIQKVIGAAGGGLLLDHYIAMIYMVMSMVVSVPAALTALRIHNEEKRGRLEQIFAKAAPRGNLYGCFILIAVVESAVMEGLLSAGLWAASSGALHFGSLLKAGLCYLPAIWTMVGLAVLLVGFLPGLSALVWAMFGYTFIVMYFGRVMDVPEWMTRITPFGNIPQLPVEQFEPLPLAILTLVAAVLAALGVCRFKERDIG